MNTELNYDYTESDCNELTDEEMLRNLAEKMRLHSTCLMTFLLEMIWTEEELCPKIYTVEDIKEINRQRKFHTEMCHRISKIEKEYKNE